MVDAYNFTNCIEIDSQKNQLAKYQQSHLKSKMS